MTWQSPWAWAGLFVLAVPLLIHLFTRHTARVQPFPALRFFDSTLLRPVRRTRIQDLLLLLVRMAVLAAAVAALAQPYFPAAGTRAEATLARVIIVDSSASMLRDSAVFARAREAAQASVAEATVSRVVVSNEAARAIDGAAAWLATRPGTREIVILSDFQYGEFAATDFARIPDAIGIRLRRIDPDSVAGASGARPLSLLAAANTDSGAETPQSRVDAVRAVQLLAGATQTQLANATLEAALTTHASLHPDTARPVAIVFPDYEERTRLLEQAAAPNQPWQGDLLASIAADTTITRIARAESDGRNTLLLFTDASPGTLAAAKLVSAVLYATAQQPPADEQETETLDDATLASWERTAVAGDVTTADASHGRWFWLIALLLLGLESWLRRQKKLAAEVQHARAA